ncbi:hypothetical protein [Ensifer sesbaniae]|jgi:hypothetical protein|uniref:hypothetical protein n=1 Tax=Ensifer sesbaniae TaxID=1214071 RepID=UPI001FEACF1F|nr:hypothetical protein [Ensifer sesbaniae]
MPFHRICAFRRQQVVLFALVVRQADANLNAAVLLELLDEILRQELVIGGDLRTEPSARADRMM